MSWLDRSNPERDETPLTPAEALCGLCFHYFRADLVIEGQCVRCIEKRQERLKAPPDLKLMEVCSNGAYFCPRCIHYQSSVNTCGKCGRTMKFQPPIF
jgi:hypothetical protein